MLFRTRLRTALPLLSLALLAGCAGAPESTEPQVISGSGAPTEDTPIDDAQSDGAQTESPTDPESGAAGDGAGSTAVGDITAQVQADGTILVDGTQASFLMPSHNVACVVKPDNAVCQIDGKQYAAKKDDIDPLAFEGCTRKKADAMSVGDGADPTWACLPYDIRPGTDVASGGAWAGPGVGATDTLGDATVAVLPYGSTLRLGNMSCSSDSAGVDCTDLTTGRGFQLAREGYTTH